MANEILVQIATPSKRVGITHDNKLVIEGKVIDAVSLAAIADLTDNSGGTASATIAAATNTTALTHAVGTADGTVADVGAAFSQTTLNDNFKELTTELATQRALNTVLTNAVASLAAKVNAILGGLS